MQPTSSSSANAETRANIRAPAYPNACADTDRKVGDVQRVVVSYDVDSQGARSNVRIIASTDPCFNEAAIAAVRASSAVPPENRRIMQAANGLEASFKFVLGADAVVSAQTLAPIKRLPPTYPKRCLRYASNFETVFLEYDVISDGTVDNVRVVETSLECLNAAAVRAAEKWRYEPKKEKGAAVLATDIQTAITFQIANDKDFTVRRAFKKRFDKIKRDFSKDKATPDETIQALKALEADMGADFTVLEASAFYNLRAAARLKINQLPEALDDLKRLLASGAGLDGDGAERIQALVRDIEAYLEGQDAKNPGTEDLSNDKQADQTPNG